MKIEELTSLMEKVMDQALTPEKMSDLISPIVLQYLKSDEVKKHMVMTAGELAPKQAEDGSKIGFSRWLGDIKRMCLGKEPIHTKNKEMDFIPVMEKADGLHASSVDAAHQKLLYEGANASGGFLVPTEESKKLLDFTNLFEVVAPLCTQVPMTTNSITFPTLTAGLTAFWIPEAATTSPSGQAAGQKQETTPTFAQMNITAHTLAIYVFVSNQLLDDSDPAVDNILFNLFGKTLGSFFDVAILRGAGSGTDPISGLVSQVTSNVLQTGAQLDFDDVLDLIYSCYDNSGQGTLRIDVIGNTKSERLLLKVKDNDGQYLFKGPAASVDGVPSIWTEPWRRDNNILNNLGTGSNKTRIFAGDFQNFAFVGNRSQIVIRANPWGTGFPQNQTAFLAEFRKGFTLDSNAEDRFAILNNVPTT